MNKKAFTLLELLIVIAIMGVLAGLLATALVRVRESARRTQCANNLRQHGIAWYIYLLEHDDVFPQLPIPSDDDNKYFIWGGKRGTGPGYAQMPAAQRILNPYLEIYSDANIGALEIFHCPSDKFPIPGITETTIFDKFGNSYHFNPLLWGLNMTSVTNPKTKVLMELDASRQHMIGGVDHTNVLFIDGHVRIHRYTQDWTSEDVTFEPNSTTQYSP